MFTKVALYTTVALATFVAAAPGGRGGGGSGGGGSGGSQCSTGDVYCCNSVQSASSPTVTALLGLLGIVLGPVDGLVGLTCNPISVIGIGGNSCSAQTVCCTGNNYSGIIVVGCSPITINL